MIVMAEEEGLDGVIKAVVVTVPLLLARNSNDLTSVFIVEY